MQRRSLIAFKTFSDAAVRAIGFLLLVLCARGLSREEFGIFSLAWAAGWIVSLGTDFGLQLYLAREVARQPEGAWSVFVRLLRLKLLLGGAALVLTALAGAWLPWAGHRLAFVLLVWTQIGFSLVEFINYFYRGLSRSDLESIVNLAYRSGAFLFALPVLWFHPALPALAWALAAATGLAVAGTSVVSRRFAAGASVSPLPLRPGRVFRRVLPIGIGIVLSALYFRVDVFLIERWVGIVAVAHYNAVFRLVDALRMLPAAVLAVIFPEMCRDPGWKTLLRTGAALAAAGALLCVLVQPLSGVLVERIYGPGFSPAAGALDVLLLCLPLLFANFALTHQLTAWNLQRFYALLCLLALIFNLALNWWLIPRLAIEGAAWSTLGTEVLLALGCVWILLWKGSREVKGLEQSVSGAAAS